MRILSISGFGPYWGHYPPNVLDRTTDGTGPCTTVGGGEEAFLRTAAGLAGLGHKVVAYHCGQSGAWRGVDFHGPERPIFPALAEGWDVVLGWSTVSYAATVKRHSPRARYLLCQQLNDLRCEGDWRAVDCVVSPSADHAEQVRKWGWLGQRAVVHNGLDPQLYTNAPNWEERPLWVGYWSSPDRGLHHLLRAWPFVQKCVPKARLHIFYEIERYLRMTERIRGAYQYGARAVELGRLVAHAKVDPSIELHGAVPRQTLASVQRNCRVLAYPYDPFGYCEGFAGAVNQGLAAGCTVMATPKDALPSLYGDTIYWLRSPIADPGYWEYLAGEIVTTLANDVPGGADMRKRARIRGASYNWDAAALDMEAACLGRVQEHGKERPAGGVLP